jgi:hypothetical protein
MTTLRSFESKGYRIRERGYDETELEELAGDCIADLFGRNERGEFVDLRRYFGKHAKRTGSDEEWLVLLRKLVWNRVRQRLSRIFRERDPESAGLVRAVRQFAVSHRKFKIEERLGRDWLFEKSSGVSAFSPACFQCKPGLTLPDLEDCFSVFRPGDTVPELIHKTFGMVRSQGKAGAVPVGDLVRLFKTYRNQVRLKAASPGHVHEDPISIMEEAEFRQTLDALLSRVYRKINQSYIGKGKLDFRTAGAMKRALAAMLVDYSDGGVTRSHYQYLRDHLPDLDERTYRARLRIRFEYLVRTMKSDTRKIFF